MFCSKCGKEIAEGVAFCPNCGAPVNKSKTVDQAVDSMFDATEKEVTSAVNEVKNTFSNQNYSQGQNSYKPILKADRGIVSYILLSLITCGIYNFFFIHSLAKDVNVACNGDGENTAGFAKYFILSLITCGIYSIIWEYSLANRLASNAPRYGFNMQENGTTVLLWMLFGSLICGIGPFVAMNIIIKNSNKVCMGYNNSAK